MSLVLVLPNFPGNHSTELFCSNFRVINEWFAVLLGERKPALRLAICFHVVSTEECLDGKSEKRRISDWEEVAGVKLSRNDLRHCSSRNVLQKREESRASWRSAAC